MDADKVLIIGSGPIVIGQACEFDYSGTQACKALRGMGREIVLVNSNPATIMTDPEMADTTYIEPLNPDRLNSIVEREKPGAVLPNLGGQSALNLCAELCKNGSFEKNNVRLAGVQADAISRGEDRVDFKETMTSLGIDMARSEAAESVADAVKIAEKLGYPVVVRPAYTMGGAGGGLVHNREELETVAARGLQASRVNQILIEESVEGWEELELEVIRDRDNNMITVCFIENVDPMGVHTGDSLCVAPMLTISEELQKRLQDMAYRIVERVGVIGGTNVQFAHDPRTGRVIVIEINPRTSRSSALASKATGFPIALVSAKLAMGMTLAEMEDGVCGTLDKYVPGKGMVALKFARWDFEKFRGVDDRLGTQMRAVGEVMSLGATFKEALQKAVRSLENGRLGMGFAKNFGDLSRDELLKKLSYPSSERYFVMYEALRKGATVDEIHGLTRVKPWFIEQIRELVEEEAALSADDDAIIRAKRDGFSDGYMARRLGVPEDDFRKRRSGVVQKSWRAVHVSGTRDSVYFYSTYSDGPSLPASVGAKPRVMILGGGPNRIGQGIEFDYCCVHAAKALRELGFESIMVNCNPETVSTDYDTADRLYFEPLTLEDVLSIYEREKPLGLIAQFGGQTPLNLAADLEKNGVKILGTSPEVINMAEDRGVFRAMMERLGIPMPESSMASTPDEALKVAKGIGYPVMVRPSYVLGGRGMRIIENEAELSEYMSSAAGPVLVDRFLQNALECEADAICDGERAFVPAVMEHIELAGIHSGDSACIIPSKHIPPEALTTIRDYTRRIAQELHVVGLMNMQYAIEDGRVYVLEANPRASRTVPLVSKVCGINMVRVATGIMVGRLASVASLNDIQVRHYGVKEAVFPFSMFPEVDPILGPEMQSTGEVLGIAETVGEAFFKAQEAAGSKLPLSGTVLLSISDRDKAGIADIARGFGEMGFRVLATEGTCKYLQGRGTASEMVEREAIQDMMADGKIQLIINTPGRHVHRQHLRRDAVRLQIPYITTIAAARAALEGIEHVRRHSALGVKPLQEWLGR